MSDVAKSSSNTKLKSFSFIPSEQKINNVKKRLVTLSPTVELGFERECNKMDFLREGEKPIGRGAFGEVWKVVHHPSNRTFCIKILDKHEIAEQKLIAQLNQEIEIMYKIEHPHSIKLINHFEDDDKIYMIMNIAAKGTLFSYLKENYKLNEKTAAQLFRETLSIVKYLHSFEPKIVHRDIKPENLLLDEDMRIKLCDYGWACYFTSDSKLKTYCGTPEYVSPEMLRKIGYDEKIDIWALGVLLFEMLAGYAPFSANSKEDLYSNVLKVKINWPNDFPPLAKDLVMKILRFEPSERISIDEMLKHPWMQQTPKIKEELNCLELSKKEILLSHMINMDSLNSSDETNEESKENINNTNLSVISSFSCNGNYGDANAKKVINTLRMQNIQLDSQYMELKEKYKEIYTLREKCSTLLEENEKCKNEIDLYKKMNKERDALVKENDERAHIIIKLQNRIKEYEIKASLIQKIKEENEYNKKIIKEKDDMINKLQEQVNNRNEFNNEIKSIEDIPNYLQNFKTFINNKITSITDMLTYQKKMYKVDKDNNISVLNAFSEQIKTVLDLVNKNFILQLKAITESFSFKSSKTFETIDFLNKELHKYQEYKGKSSRLEKELTIVKENINLLIEKNKILTQQVESSKKLNELQESKIKKQSTIIMNLDAKIMDIKSFLSRIDIKEEIISGFYSIIN